MDRIVAWFCAVVGAATMPIFEFFYGHGEPTRAFMTALLFFIILDWMSGIRASKRDHTYGSKYGIDGVFRTFFMFLLPAGGNLLDKALQLPGIAFGAMICGLLYHVIQSMIANSIRAGWADWLPLSVLERLSEWVKSELDKKVNRSKKRKDETSG
ncbi:phage holin family protein [Marinicrinis lubricantis]|uniref:Phage holin family protein n=1 Tax=Marinicrinis lubricantis TaxID=2086470 RepID=A0ABW1IHD4_9BACL